jgi:hypothetical protein
MDNELSKIKNLMERIERPYTSALNEAKSARVFYDFNEFIDALKMIKGGTRITLGYVTGADVTPRVRKRNPKTNRPKLYMDYSSLSYNPLNDEEGGQEISAAVRVRRYNINFRTTKSVDNEYSEYKKKANEILASYNLSPIKDKNDKDYTTNMNYGGSGGVKVYNKDNEEHKGEGYINYNLYGVKPISDQCYAVNAEGHILGEIPFEEYKAIKKESAKRTPGASEMRERGDSEEQINELIKKIDSLKMFYMVFKWSSLMFVSATVDGEKRLLINRGLKRVINDVNINPNEFLDLLNNYYTNELEG